MGWKPGKLLKKVGKGLKKAVKSIGKGIKKVVGKIGAAIGKLGVIGQIGMMFLMPYAMSGLSSFFGGVGGKIATWSTNLATSNPVVSKFLGAVHKAGSMAVNAYNTVTTAIGNGVDRVGNFFKGEGFTLSADRASVFNRPPSTPDVIPDIAELDPKFEVDLPVEKITPNLDLDLKPVAPTYDAVTGEITGGTMVDASKTITSISKDSLLSPDPKTFGQNVKDFFTELPGDVAGGVKDAFADPGQMVTDTLQSGLTRGAVSGISNKVASSIMGDPPVQRQHVTTQNLSQELYNDPTGMYNSINVALTQQGSPWGAGNLAHFNYMQEGLSDGSDEYARLMQRIS